MAFYLFNRTHPPERALKFWTFTKEISWPWAWEGLKASGIILLGICVFLVPGIIKSVHYTFFSFIVFFDQDYKAGKVSCLKRSKELSKGIGWWIFGLGIVFAVFDSECTGCVFNKLSQNKFLMDSLSCFGFVCVCYKFVFYLSLFHAVFYVYYSA